MPSDLDSVSATITQSSNNVLTVTPNGLTTQIQVSGYQWKTKKGEEEAIIEHERNSTLNITPTPISDEVATNYPNTRYLQDIIRDMDLVVGDNQMQEDFLITYDFTKTFVADVTANAALSAKDVFYSTYTLPVSASTPGTLWTEASLRTALQTRYSPATFSDLERVSLKYPDYEKYYIKITRHQNTSNQDSEDYIGL